MNLIKENIEFKRGQNSKNALNVGLSGLSGNKLVKFIKADLEKLGFQKLKLEKISYYTYKKDDERWTIQIPPPSNVENAYNYLLRYYPYGAWDLSYAGKLISGKNHDLASILKILKINYMILLETSIINAEQNKKLSEKMLDNFKRFDV